MHLTLSPPTRIHVLFICTVSTIFPRLSSSEVDFQDKYYPSLLSFVSAYRSLVSEVTTFERFRQTTCSTASAADAVHLAKRLPTFRALLQTIYIMFVSRPTSNYKSKGGLAKDTWPVLNHKFLSPQMDTSISSNGHWAGFKIEKVSHSPVFSCWEVGGVP